MKKTTLALAAIMTASSMFGLQRAFYVKQGDSFTKFNFGVASDLVFSNGGKTLTVTGYKESIDLEKIDYITFTPEVDEVGLTPTAQKEKMIQIGEAVNAVTDLNKVADLLVMIDGFSRGDESTDWYCPAEFEFPESFWNIHGVKEIIKQMGAVFHGTPAAVRAMTSAATDIYKASDYYGVYTANYEEHTWEKTASADYLELQYKANDGKDCAARLTCSTDYTVWSSEDGILQFPKTMTVTFTYNGKTVGTAVINSVLEQDTKITMDVTAEAGGYKVVNNLVILDNGITDDVTVTLDGKYIVSANTNVDGNHLLHYSEMKEAIDDCLEKEIYENGNLEYIDGDATKLFSHVLSAYSKADVLNQLQVKGRVFNFDKLYQQMSKDSWYDNNFETPEGSVWTRYKLINWDKKSGIMTVALNNSKVEESIAQHLNNYSDVQFFYDGTPTIQGFMGWEVNEDPYEYDNYIDENYGYVVVNGYVVSVDQQKYYEYDENLGQEVEKVIPWGYYAYDNDRGESVRVPVDANDVMQPTIIREFEYETMPLITFPDLTTYAFEDYFTEMSFKKLVDDYNTIIATYKNICNIPEDEY